MRSILALALFLAAPHAVRADAPERYTVPRVERGASLPDEVLLPPDIVLAPGESPTEALSRALHGDERPSLPPKPPTVVKSCC
jgi:hypothetical protein